MAQLPGRFPVALTEVLPQKYTRPNGNNRKLKSRNRVSAVNVRANLRQTERERTRMMKFINCALWRDQDLVSKKLPSLETPTINRIQSLLDQQYAYLSQADRTEIDRITTYSVPYMSVGELPGFFILYSVTRAHENILRTINEAHGLVNFFQTHTFSIGEVPKSIKQTVAPVNSAPVAPMSADAQQQPASTA